DGAKIRSRVSPEYLRLGFPEPLFVSGLTGVGTGDLLDHIVARIPHRQRHAPLPDLRLAIIGKTNVGKSSIINSILGTDRVIVTPYPHTTRESQDIEVAYRGKTIMLVDTAGMRRQGTKAPYIERLSRHRTEAAIRRADVCLLVTDVSQPLSTQDQVIAHLAADSSTGVAIAANKWDLVRDKTPEKIENITKLYGRYFAGLTWAPVTFTSALERQRVHRLIDIALAVQAERAKQLPPEALEKVFNAVRPERAKPSKGTKPAVVLRLIQTGTKPPQFSLITRFPDRIHPAFCNLVAKELRKRYGFSGTPVSVSISKPS
ncbi:MAG: GTP-binding protein, partial [Patescibacteria group bacterium]